MEAPFILYLSSCLLTENILLPFDLSSCFIKRIQPFISLPSYFLPFTFLATYLPTLFAWMYSKALPSYLPAFYVPVASYTVFSLHICLFSTSNDCPGEATSCGSSPQLLISPKYLNRQYVEATVYKEACI